MFFCQRGDHSSKDVTGQFEERNFSTRTMEGIQSCHILLAVSQNDTFQEISNRTVPERTPKPEYQKTLDLNLLNGVRWDSVPFNF